MVTRYSEKNIRKHPETIKGFLGKWALLTVYYYKCPFFKKHFNCKMPFGPCALLVCKMANVYVPTISRVRGGKMADTHLVLCLYYCLG